LVGGRRCTSIKPRVAADVKVSIGRTNSKRALGFRVMTNDKHLIDFVLDRDQVAELTAFLGGAKAGLSKPLGRKPPGMSFVISPKQQLDLTCPEIFGPSIS
jgi:hypothetical protein